MRPQTNRYVFVQNSLDVGGVETMIVRLANYASSNDYNVSIFSKGGSLYPLLDEKVDHVCWKGGYLSLVIKLTKYAMIERKTDMVVINFSPAMVVVAQLVRILSGNSVRFFHVVVHPRAFFFDTYPIFAQFLSKHVFLSAPRESAYFMNIAVRASHASRWKVDLDNYPILRLPITPQSGVKVRRKSTIDSRPLRIVSIGRLVPFKAYNYASLDIVEEFIKSGTPVEWCIYGDGECAESLENEIAERGLSQNVRLMGVLPYEKFSETVREFDVFVGMGTALLEAAACNLPSICAIENGGNTCYGFLHTAPSDSVGEFVPGGNSLPLCDVLFDFSRLSSAQRTELGFRDAASAGARSSSLQEVWNEITRAPKWRNRVIGVLAAVVYLFVFLGYDLLRTGSARNMALRIFGARFKRPAA